MEPKYRHRYPPCPDYDVGCMEAWLEHMAQKGLHLDGASGFFLGLATFMEGQPAQVKYRLETVPKARGFFEDNSAPTDEAVEMAQEMGWEYVCRLREFDIYRSEGALAPELNTDPQLQAQSLKAVEKRMRGQVSYALFWWILYPLLRSFGPVYTAVHAGSLLTLWGWGLLVGQLLVALYRVWFLARMRKGLLRGEAPRRPQNLRKAGLRYRIGHGLHIAAAQRFLHALHAFFHVRHAPDDAVHPYSTSICMPRSTSIALACKSASKDMVSGSLTATRHSGQAALTTTALDSTHMLLTRPQSSISSTGCSIRYISSSRLPWVMNASGSAKIFAGAGRCSLA